MTRQPNPQPYEPGQPSECDLSKMRRRQQSAIACSSQPDIAQALAATARASRSQCGDCSPRDGLSLVDIASVYGLLDKVDRYAGLLTTGRCRAIRSCRRRPRFAPQAAGRPGCGAARRAGARWVEVDGAVPPAHTMCPALVLRVTALNEAKERERSCNESRVPGVGRLDSCLFNVARGFVPVGAAERSPESA